MRFCEYCKSEIPRTVRDHAKKYASKRYCSITCANRGRGIPKSGYRRKRHNGKMMPLHRVMMEQHLGRDLEQYEIVHHINGDRLDNRIENLEVMSKGDHARLHNDRHPRIKICAICNREFVPHPTKRERAQCCSRECGTALMKKKARERMERSENE